MKNGEDRINIGRDRFQRALAIKMEEGAWTEAQGDLLHWLYGYAHQSLSGSKRRLALAIGYDWTVIFKIYTGSYEAKIDKFCEAIEHLKKKVLSGGTELISTEVTEKINHCLDYTRDYNGMSLITGPTGRSKTFAAQEWVVRNNHGRAMYVRCPSATTPTKLMRGVCRAAGIGCTAATSRDMEAQLIKSLGWKNTIVVDEAGHMVPRTGRNRSSSLEFLRDLHDMCGCGICLIIPDVYWNELVHGPISAWFEQFLGRIKYRVQIPKKVLDGELLAICQGFVGDREVDEKMMKLARLIVDEQSGNLRALCDDLKHARRLADKKGVDINAQILNVARMWRQQGGVWSEA